MSRELTRKRGQSETQRREEEDGGGE